MIDLQRQGPCSQTWSPHPCSTRDFGARERQTSYLRHGDFGELEETGVRERASCEVGMVSASARKIWHAWKKTKPLGRARGLTQLPDDPTRAVVKFTAFLRLTCAIANRNDRGDGALCGLHSACRVLGPDMPSAWPFEHAKRYQNRYEHLHVAVENILYSLRLIWRPHAK